MTFEEAIEKGLEFIGRAADGDRDFVALETSRGFLLQEVTRSGAPLIGGERYLFVDKITGKVKASSAGEWEFLEHPYGGFLHRIYMFLARRYVHGQLTGPIRFPDTPLYGGVTIHNVFELRKSISDDSTPRPR